MSFLALTVGSILLAPTAFAGDGVDRVPQDFPTLAAALKEGTAPVIELGPGRHQGAVVSRPVRIVGQEGAVIDRGVRYGDLLTALPLTAGAKGSEIRDLTFECAPGSLDAGVYASARRKGAPSNITVSGNTFRGCIQAVTNAGHDVETCEASKLTGGAYWVVTGNTFDGFATRASNGAVGGGIGVMLHNVRGADVIENLFTGQVDDTPAFTTSGVFMSGCWDCTVALNEFEVTGGTHYWSAISNFGYYQFGGAPSRNVVLADNNATHDSAPHRKVSFRSYDSYAVDLANNSGETWVDHGLCGDGRLR